MLALARGVLDEGAEKRTKGAAEEMSGECGGPKRSPAGCELPAGSEGIQELGRPVARYCGGGASLLRGP
jgi:hypothetical protein